EAFTDERDELGQARGRHGEALVLALADDRLGEGLLPFGRERDQRQVAVGRGVLGADLARKPRAYVLDQVGRIAGKGERVRDAFQDRRQVADRDALGKEELEYALDARDGDLR